MLEIFIPIIILLVLAVSLYGLLFEYVLRNRDFRNIANKYGLEFKRIPVYRYQTIAANPPLAGRIIEGNLNGKHVLVGDYTPSTYWPKEWSLWVRTMYIVCPSWTRIFIDGQEVFDPTRQSFPMASKKKIISLLEEIK